MTATLHERIRSDIEAGILSGALAPGARLLTEHALMAHYGCARMTVNRALGALAAAGLIERRKRAGSFVARPRVHAMILDVPDLPQALAARGLVHAYRLLDRATVDGGAGLAGSLFDAGAGPALSLAGLHLADGQPIAIEHRLVSLATVPAIAAARFDAEPPGSWLLRHVPWSKAETRLSAAAADRETAALLLLAAGAPLLVIERRTWRGDACVTAVRQAFRADSYDLFASFEAGDRRGR